MTYIPPPPTRPPTEFPWADPPDEMLAKMRATGISDTQSIALIKSILWQTYILLEANERVTWPYLGRWEGRTYSRTVFNIPSSEIPDPITSIITIDTITKSAMQRLSLRPRWRGIR